MKIQGVTYHDLGVWLKKKKNTITYGGTPTFSDGVLTSETNYVKIPSAIAQTILTLSSGFTIECEYIATSDSLDNYYNQLWGFSNGSNLLSLALNTGRVRVISQKSGGTSTIDWLTSLSVGRHKIGVTGNSNEISTYVDGVKMPNPSITPNVPEAVSDIYINYCLASGFPANGRDGGGYLSHFVVTKGKRPVHEMCRRTSLNTQGFPIDKYVSYAIPLKTGYGGYNWKSPKTATPDTIGASKVLITFDDYYSSVYTSAFSIMNTAGLVGTFYIRTGYVGGGGAVTWEQLAEMDAGGWSIANHTENHVLLNTQSLADQITAINNAKTTLLSNGHDGAYHLAYPNGAYNADTITANTTCGILTGVTTASGQQYTPLYHQNDDKYMIPRFMPINTTTSSQVLAYVDNAIARGDTSVLCFHSLVESDPTTYQMTTATFQEIIDGIVTRKNAGTITDMNVVDWYNYAK